MIRTLLISAAAMSVAGPAGAAPSQPPPAWLAAPVAAAQPIDAYWRGATTDPILRDLLEAAGAIDDVAIAAARRDEADAFRRAARAALFPSLTVSGEAAANAAESVAGASRVSGGAAITAPIDVSGGLRARSRAAAARLAASEADLAAARVEARRTAGQLYAALRGAQASRAAAEQQTRDATASLALAQARTSAGLDSNLAVAQAQSAADAARARIPGFVHAETRARLGLEALFGVRPGAFLERLAPADSAPIDARAFMDAPAAVIERRPDIQAAAARLAATGLDARAARADRWPTLGLTLSALQTSATRAAFGDVVGSSGAATLTLAGTLFDFGRLDALADAADARARAEAAAYRRTVTYAVADVEREADRLARAIEERDAARAARDSAREQARLAAVRYGGGLSSFVEVLLAERAAADAAITLAAAEARALDAGVSLAAALGLGQAPSSSAGAAVQ